ncbi:hypothetical protein CPter291_3032 [Collimonas pratensis]|uniref:Uncharacterized protein n=1 Tax=Collimonas pratensis TaxID=279113 RepID=A0ABN4MD01_9BURK|nr:hypothetical protein CPter291_3032 [Collimonas pratensis]
MTSLTSDYFKKMTSLFRFYDIATVTERQFLKQKNTKNMEIT